MSEDIQGMEGRIATDRLSSPQGPSQVPFELSGTLWTQIPGLSSRTGHRESVDRGGSFPAEYVQCVLLASRPGTDLGIPRGWQLSDRDNPSSSRRPGVSSLSLLGGVTSQFCGGWR